MTPADEEAAKAEPAPFKPGDTVEMLGVRMKVTACARRHEYVPWMVGTVWFDPMDKLVEGEFASVLLTKVTEPAFDYDALILRRMEEMAGGRESATFILSLRRDDMLHAESIDIATSKFVSKVIE